MFRTGQRRGTRYHLRDDGDPVREDDQHGAAEGLMAPALETATRQDEGLGPDLAAVEGMRVISTWLSGLDPRRLDIVRQRLVAREAATLEEVGTTYGVTRERIRQLESRLVAETRKLTAQATGDAALTSLIDELRDRAGSLAPLREVLEVEHERDLNLTSRVLLWMADYVCTDTLLLADGFALPTAHYLPLVDDGPLLDRVTLHEELLRDGVRPEYLPVAEASLEGVKEVDGALVLWPRSAVDRCLAILTVRGEPMSVEALIDGLGEQMSVRSLRQRLYEDERFVRASKDRIGLRAWGAGEYTTIVSLMRAAVTDGPRPLAHVAEELRRDFDVRPSSVNSYARAPLFVVEDGTLRLRGADEPFEVSEEPQRVSGLYRSSESELIWHCRIDEDLQRGSGRTVPKELATFFGLVPGGTVELGHGGDTVVMTWLRESHLGPSLGSLRALATEAGGKSGDVLRLFFNRDYEDVTAELVGASGPGESDVQALARLTGLPERQCRSRAAMGLAVDTAGADIVAVLRARGDVDVAELVAGLPGS